MSGYIYNDEDNAPMNEENLDQRGHNVTTYSMPEEEKVDELPFAEEPPRVCGTCAEYNGTYCTRYWNNLDECYKDTERDAREPEDKACDYYEFDPEWHDYFEI